MKLLIFFVLAFSVFTLTVSAMDDRGRMFNSYTSQENQFPTVVRLQMYFGASASDCTGTIIRKDWVVTAAHCVDNDGFGLDNVAIFMGSSQRGGVNEKKVVVDSSNIFIHGEYNITGVAENDIALVRMPPITTSPNIQIASTDYSMTNYEGEITTVAGWGTTDMDDTFPDKLQYNTYTVMNEDFCSKYFYMVPGLLCLYNKNASSCPGDSGGPSLWGNECIGAASFINDDGCEKEGPMAYTYLPYFADWMNYVMDRYSL